MVIKKVKEFKLDDNRNITDRDLHITPSHKLKEVFRNFKFEYKITLIYFVFGFLWILFSDNLLDILQPDDSLLTKLQTFKGSFFIVVTYVFLYLLVKGHMKKLRIAETQRFESEFRFAKLWDNGPFGLMMVGKEFQYKNVNPEFCKFLDYSEDELLQLTFKDISHPDDLARDLTNMRKLISKEISVYKTEKRYIRKGGQVIWGALTVFPNYDKDGDFLYNLAIVEDITRRKLAEEDLKNSKKLLAETESIGKVGGWEFNIETLETIWTEEVYRIHEVDFDFYHNVNEGINFYTLESRPIIEKAVQRVIEFGEPFDLELEITTAKGNLKNVHTIGKLDVENQRVYGFFQDITERKKAEVKIRQMNDQLEQRVKERTSQLEAAIKELEAFSYSVSHDLRAPLRHINGFAELLINNYSEDLPEDARKHLNTIMGSAKKMGTLIDDLLSFSKTGRAELKKSTFKMNKVIDETLAQIKPSLIDRKIEWHISQLPEIYVDYNLLRQVWINLIDNAVKYTRTRKNAVIDIGYFEDKNETVFYIKDNGVGFDMKYADKLFGVFQRLHTSSQFDGTGVGLANVHRIILRHGGKTWATAEPDKGAEFYFSIPK